MADTYRFLSMPLAPATFRFAGPNPRKPAASPANWSSFTRPAQSKTSRTLPSTRTWSKASAPALENETSKRGARENMSTNPIIRYRHPIYGEQLRPQLNSPKASAQFAESFSSSGKRTASGKRTRPDASHTQSIKDRISPYRQETGNEQETKRGFLCKTGNGHCFHPIRAYAQSPPFPSSPEVTTGQYAARNHE